MEDKQLVSSGKMTQYLIGNWLLWGILVGIIYSFIFSFLTIVIKSVIARALLAVVIQGLVAFLLWKWSTSSSFKKKTISYSDVPTVMRNLIIFTVILCIITALYNLSTVNSSIDKAVSSNYELAFNERMMSNLYSKDQMDKYNREKEKVVSEAKAKAYTYVIILEVGLMAIYLGVLPFEKREILKYVKKEV